VHDRVHVKIADDGSDVHTEAVLYRVECLDVSGGVTPETSSQGPAEAMVLNSHTPHNGRHSDCVVAHQGVAG
jgi:hypothetical protein